ncbi:cryptochrome/photolyase family protein [Mycolicibacterium iranicum]|uniref:Deoxyribodipyrimidine photolyase n=1 Tax=Mycolicibacterium iranicum TaxID=912594 RepID=A0A178LZY0_MYCIR|nr:deoxyribodipyrimidine photo-lyase [Mycolicibacterium iranicum]OAN39655.1 deoxyribodipyrimidine photolyase [Mycolicibacterium iranicum]
MPAVLWFRRDLRLADLPALLAAAEGDGEVLACYVLDPTLKASSGQRRLQYLYEALRDLQGSLGGRLLVTRGDAKSVIPKLAKSIGASTVHISEEHLPYGRRRDEAVREALRGARSDGGKTGDVDLVATGSPYLVSPGRVTKGDGSPYKVFTPFYDAWRKHGWRKPAESGTKSARWIDPDDVKGARAVEIPDLGVELDRPAGESGAREQWAEFVEDGLADYSDDRNRPDLDGTSRMSAHLKFGTIHPRTLAADLGRGTGAQAYLRELAFRDFYASVVHEWPRSTWWNWNTTFDAIEVDDGREAKKSFETWKAGKTGFPIVDAGMRQLAETGFMHNRVRMIVASFLVKDLHLPWQWGARWFLDQLVDGDMANNQHGWQWAAGCGTDAAPYFRVFNPTTQGKKFDPSGAYVKRWVPELRDVDDVHNLDRDRPDDYPQPIVDHKQEREEALRRYNAL